MTGADRRALRDTVNRFRAQLAKESAPVVPPDDAAHAVLDRLVEEEWAEHVLPAFCAVPMEDWPLLIRDCLLADRAMREHKQIAEAARRMNDQTPAAKNALKTVTSHLKLAGYETKGDDPVAEALGLLRALIENTERDATRAAIETGRKIYHAAARSAGIGWLAEAMRRAAPNSPNHRGLTAELASAVLNEEVSEDMVAHAAGPIARLKRSLALGAFDNQKSRERAG